MNNANEKSGAAMEVRAQATCAQADMTGEAGVTIPASTSSLLRDVRGEKIERLEANISDEHERLKNLVRSAGAVQSHIDGMQATLFHLKRHGEKLEGAAKK
jgi:hypothetical protein